MLSRKRFRIVQQIDKRAGEMLNTSCFSEFQTFANAKEEGKSQLSTLYQLYVFLSTKMFVSTRDVGLNIFIELILKNLNRIADLGSLLSIFEKQNFQKTNSFAL